MKPHLINSTEVIQNLVNNSDFEKLGIDLKTDPFGRNYDWLQTPQSPFDLAYEELVNAEPTRWHATAGKAVRNVALSDMMASGTDQAVLEAWVNERFPALCILAGENGACLSRMVKRHGDNSRGIIEEVVLFLNQQPELAELTDKERVAVALMITAHHGPERT